MAAEGGESQPQAKLQPGDVILSAGRSCRARLINFFQALFARDRTRKYNNAALVTSGAGDILHATRWFIKYTSLKRRYRRSRVRVVRWRGMTRDRFRQGFAEVSPLHGPVKDSLPIPFNEVFLRQVCSQG